MINKLTSHMARAWRTTSHPWLRAVLALAALIAIGMYAYAASHRARYPYELEWMEGAMVDHVARVLAGKPIYTRPSLEFVPFVYPPLYYWVSAASASLFGLGFFALRFVSLVSSFGALVLLGVLVHHETRAWTPAIVAAGVMAATYPLSGAWLDIARVDSLFVLLLLTAILIVRRFDSTWGVCAAAVVATAAYHSKQSAAIVAAALALMIALSSVRRAVLFGALFAALVVASSYWLEQATHGWFGFYTVAVVRGHAIAHEMHAIFWRDELLRPCGFGIALTLCFLLLPAPLARTRARAFFGLAIGALIVTAWLSRVHSGGWLNVLIPAHVGVALGAGLGLHALLELSSERRAGRAAWLGGALVGAQLAALAYDPRVFIPTRDDKLAGDQLLSRLRDMPGEVLLTHHGYLPTLVGKRVFAHHMAVIDVMRSTANAAGAKEGLLAEFEAGLRAHRFSAVVIDNRDPPYLPYVERFYLDIGRWPYRSEDVFYPRTGARIRPDVIFEPRRP